MKLFITFLLTAMAGILTGNAQDIIYVATGAQGTGESWDSPADLQSALQTAEFGTQIWMKAGIYHPTTSNNRKAFFKINDGIQLYGGFAGNETALEQRNATANQVVLSGEIGTPEVHDNSYTVVKTVGASDATLLDGFTISDAFANGSTAPGTPDRCGGAVFNCGKNKTSSPVFRNIIFTNNSAREGGAVYNYGSNGDSSPSFINCVFTKNIADLDGGAIFNDATNGGSSPILISCYFEDNMASYGAGIFSQTKQGESNVDLEKCTFKNNMAYLWGGGIYGDKMHGNFDLKMDDCQFNGNYPTDINKEIGVGMVNQN